MRRICLLALVGLLIAVSWIGVYPSSVQAADPYEFIDGDGSSADPYLVMTAEDMDHVRDYPAASFKLGDDIDLSDYSTGAGWVPIGTSSAPFTGNFDGNQYLITHLFVDRTASDYVGLFGYASNATLTNIRLMDVDITGRSYVGGLVGTAQGTKITGSSVSSTSGSVKASEYIGGLVGSLTGTGAMIEHSYAAIDVYGDRAGGLLGNLVSSSDGIESSYASGDVAGSSYIGGLVYSTRSFVKNTYATGNVTAMSERGGGLLANVVFDYGRDMMIESSFQTGAFKGGDDSESGVLIGRYLALSMTNINLVYNTTRNPPTVNPSWPAVGTFAGGSTLTGYIGLSEADMKKSSSYGPAWDFSTVWGINEDLSYPYLRAFTPIVRVNPVAQASYGLNSLLTIDGFMMDGSLGEPVEVDYEILNASHVPVASGSNTLFSPTNDVQTYSFTETLDGTRFLEGAYTINVTAEDDEGHQAPTRSVTFTVDHTPAVITQNGANPLQVSAGSTYTEPGATALDAVDGDVTSQITISGSVNTSEVGSYTIIYEVTDAAGNTATKSRTVNVVDTAIPVITLNGANPFQVSAGSTYSEPGATALDAVDGDVTSQITISGSVNTSEVGSYTIIYEVTDAAGNTATTTRVVNVVSSGGSGGSSSVKLSNNTKLAQLTLWFEGVTQALTPAYAPEITDYRVETSGEQVELQLSTVDSKAIVTVLDKPVADKTSIPLVVGTQTIKITVQAEDGTLRDYNLTITRLVDQESVPPIPAACPFTDIQGHWAQAEICEAARLNIVEGVSKSIFAPNKAISRTEFAVMLLRTLQIQVAESITGNSFSDMASIPEWARAAILTGQAMGIVNGYSDGTFRPQLEIVRAEMAVMLAKGLKWEPEPELELPFSDGASIPAWAQPYVKIVYAKGLLQGRGKDQFVPNGSTTRAEAAAVMLRLWKSLDEFRQWNLKT